MSRPVARLLLVLLCILLLLAGGSLALMFWLFHPHPSDDTVQAWRSSHRQVILQGAKDLRGHWMDWDVRLHMFSYRVPESVPDQAVLRSLAKDIGGYQVYDLTSSTLVLRDNRWEQSPDIFTEYYVIYRPASRRVGVMHMEVRGETMALRERMLNKLSEAVR